MAHRKVLVLNLGWEQQPLMDALARPERGLELYGVHADRATAPKVGFREILIADMRDLVRIIEFADRIHPDAVISDECDYALFAQALLAERYTLPGPSLQAAHLSSNKLLQCDAAKDVQIRVPDFARCLSAEDVRIFGERFGWPVILKPNDNRGSFGVSVVQRPSDATAAHARAVAHSHSRLVLVQRYIFGHHLTIDGYCAPGGTPETFALASNHKFDGDEGTVNESIVYPGDLEPAIYRDAWNLAAKTASALRYEFGPFHGEFIVERGSGRIYLTEMSNRGGGVHISNIAVPHVSRVDLVNKHIDDTLGISSSHQSGPSSVPRAAMLRFFADNGLAGRRLHSAKGLEAISRLPGVLCCRLFISPGEMFGRLESGAGRHGMIIVGADHRDKLEALASNAVEQLSIELEPEPAQNC